MNKLLLVPILASLLFTSCTKVPSDLMKPTSETLKIRETQSRSFAVSSEKQLLRASVSVLQDMGYSVKESSSDYGVLTASKDASAYSAGQIAACVLVAAFCGESMPIDKTQAITVTVVVLDKNDREHSTARTTFQRVITRTDNSCYAQTITDPLVYNDFYDKLDKALFLEVNEL